MLFKKINKLFKNPGVFFRDYFLKRNPIIRNEILCPDEEEDILMRHDLAMNNLINTSFDIDVVYTWVDNSDAVWREKFKYHLLNENDKSKYGTNDSRFENHDELYYSVRSVLNNMPWVRYIYIITDNQCPIWLKSLNSNKIRIIDHRDIIDSEYLPTFNSHVIEAHLHRINGLAENFIYFNDNVFVGRYLPASHFFGSNGVASLFLSQKRLSKLLSKGVITPTLYASLNSKKILSELNLDIDIPLVHTYVPLKKSTYNYVWDNYSDDIQSFFNNKFRSNNDYNLATFLVPWIMYNQGRSTLRRDICYYFNIRSKQAKTYYSALLNAKLTETMPHSFCINDFLSEKGNYIENYSLIFKSEIKKIV